MGTATQESLHARCGESSRHATIRSVRGSEPGLIEYSYGEWSWYAHNEDAWYRAFPAVLWPTRGTLGRRASALDAGTLRARGSVAELRVARPRAAALAARLHERYERRRGESVYNPRYGIEFVPDDDDYCAFFNCNDAVARWLVELGCEVSPVLLRIGLEVAARPER